MKPDLIAKTKIIAQKNQLWQLIKKINEIFGGDEESARIVGKEIYEDNKDNMEECIQCFQDLISQSQKLFPPKRRT